MKKILVLLVIICGICNQVLAEEITLDGVKPEHIEIPKTNVNLKTSLVINDDTVMQEIINKQKEKDLGDIEALWKGTVDNNQVIGFALKKLIGTCCRGFFCSDDDGGRLSNADISFCSRAPGTEFNQ